MPDIIEKKWRLHDDSAVTINDAAPWHIVKFKNSFGPYQIQCQLLKWFGQACFESLDLTYIINKKTIYQCKVDSADKSRQQVDDPKSQGEGHLQIKSND